MADWTTSTVTAAGAELNLRRGGKGSPVLVLHRDIGTLDRLDFYDGTFHILICFHFKVSPKHAC